MKKVNKIKFSISSLKMDLNLQKYQSHFKMFIYSIDNFVCKIKKNVSSRDRLNNGNNSCYFFVGNLKLTITIFIEILITSQFIIIS